MHSVRILFNEQLQNKQSLMFWNVEPFGNPTQFQCKLGKNIHFYSRTVKSVHWIIFGSIGSASVISSEKINELLMNAVTLCENPRIHCDYNINQYYILFFAAREKLF